MKLDQRQWQKLAMERGGRERKKRIRLVKDEAGLEAPGNVSASECGGRATRHQHRR
jgi:hypothetical protein